MKAAAALVVLIICIAEGARRSLSLKNRAVFLNEILLMLKKFSAEIRFRQLSPDELIAGAEGKFPEMVRSFLTESDIRSAWDKACGKLSQKAPETLLLRELGKSLGNSDREGMVDIISLYSEKIAGLYSEAEADYRKRGKAYLKIGALCGLGLAVLII